MFKIKMSSCTYCRLCMLACTSAHEPGVQSVKQARIHVEDDWPEIGAIHVCVACKDQPCIQVCPGEALTWEDHIVLDEDKCILCNACVDACPVGGIMIHPATGYPLICDTCDNQFSCVKVCPTGAISRR